MNNDLVIEFGIDQYKNFRFPKELTDEMRDWLANADHPTLWDALSAFRREFDLTGYECGRIIGKWTTEVM